MSHYKPYPAYRNSGVEWIGQVPEHWAECSLKHALEEMGSGGTPDTDNPVYWSDKAKGTPWIAISDMSSTELVNDCQKTVTQAGIESKRLKVFPQGTLLFSMYASLGHVAELGMAATTNQAILGLVPAAGTNQRFLKRWLQALQPYLVIDANNATQDNLNAEKVRNLPFVKAPLVEQQRIAYQVDLEVARIDALIAKKTRFIELLKEKRHALITHAVTKGLDTDVSMRETGVDWIGEVPEHWSVVQVRHVATLGSGHTPSRSRPDWWEECCIPWFTLADIWQVRREGRRFVTETEEKVSELGIANSSAVVHPAGSVILSRTASVGFPAIMGCNMATSQDFAVWRCGSRVVNEYLYLVLLGMKQELSRLMIGSTHKTIYMPDIEAFRMPLPPVEQQKEIIKYVGSELQRIDTVIAKTLRSIELLKERRAAFITAAVTGQIDLRESA